MTRRAVLALVCSLGAACGGGSSDGGAGADAGGGTGNDAGALTSWTVVDTTLDDGEIVIEKIQYFSGSLRVYGQVCRPAGEGPFPTLVVNHGGFEGLVGEWNGGICADAARNGYLVLQSSYRGEDGSDGEIEVCLGEVDDVLALIDLALARTELVRPDALLMWGASHGGCITLGAVARGAPVTAAAAAVPPTDFAALHRFWSDGLAGNPTELEQYVWTELIAVIEEATGGTPDEVPAEYQQRSPAHHVDDILAAGVPTMVVHGGADFLVPPTEGCALAAAGFAARYIVDGEGTVAADPPPVCGEAAIDWQTTPRPVGAWPDTHYIQLYDDMGHGFEGDTGPLGLFDTLDFLAARQP